MNESIIASDEEMKEEALLRMKKLNLHENVLSEFSKDGTINVSDSYGALFWVNKEELQMIENFEKEYGGKVYHVIKNVLEFGICFSLLYVGRNSDEWECDNDDLESGYPIVYVANATVPEFSEFGSIGVKPLLGGLIRTA